MATQTKPDLQPIEADSLYPIEVARTHLGLSVSALRATRRKGLRIRKVGNRSIVVGADLISFVRSCGEIMP